MLVLEGSGFGFSVILIMNDVEMNVFIMFFCFVFWLW